MTKKGQFCHLASNQINGEFHYRLEARWWVKFLKGKGTPEKFADFYIILQISKFMKSPLRLLGTVRKIQQFDKHLIFSSLLYV